MLHRAIPFAALLFAANLQAENWLRFRGPNGAGIAQRETVEKPSLKDNLLWKTALPPGHSSPIVAADKIYLTAVEDERLYTFALERESGRILWRREAPRPRKSKMHEQNNPASGTPAGDGENVYVFFGDFGLLSYGPDGGERWRVPLGPFVTIRGMAASPIVVGDKLIVTLDDDSGHSVLLALDSASGRRIWSADRSEFRKSFSIPSLYRPADGPPQLLTPGSFSLSSYALESGEEIWRTGGFCWQPKAAPMLDATHVYFNCQGAGADPNAGRYPEYADALEQFDGNGDGTLSKDEFYAERASKFFEYDFSENGRIEKDEWDFFRARMATRPGLFAVRLDAKDTDAAARVDWVVDRPMGNVPSPLLYEGVIYSIRNAGILSSIDAKTGEIVKQGRLSEAMGTYYASPVAAGGRIYFIDLDGVLTVVRAGAQWEIIHTLPLNERGNATPAIADGRLYVRTHANLYCFGD